MALRCLSFHHYEHYFVRDDGSPEPFDEWRVLLFDPRIERGTQTIGERWRTLDAAKRTADLVVIRGSHLDFASRVERDSVLRDVAGTTPILVLSGSWDVTARAPQLSAPGWSAPAPFQPDFDVLREYELLTLILESKALNRERDCHYMLPSSRFHAAQFIRLATALDDHTDLVRLADWVLPLTADGTALLGDNGSLLGLLSVVRLEAIRRFGWERQPIATLNEYPADRATLRRFMDAFHGGEDWDRGLFLITVSSSGTIASLAEALTDVDLDIVVLCATDILGNARQTCFTHYVIERWHAGVSQRCPRCKDLHQLEVDPQTYEVRPRLHRKKHRVDMAEAQRCAPFWEAVDREDPVAKRTSLSLHKALPTALGNPAGTRHLAVALHVDLLLRDTWFRGQCLEALRRQPRPDLVLIPQHDASEPMRDLVCEAHDLDPRLVEFVSVEELDTALVERLRGCGVVLIADDVVITAETLVALRRGVHRAGQPDTSIQVWGFVAVLRPPSQLEFRHVERPFTAASNDPDNPRQVRLECGFKLFLPGPGEDSCPWCDELALLEHRLEELDGEAAKGARARLDKLRAPAGLSGPLLMAGDDDVTRTIDSFFGTLSSPTAFAAVSAVTQKMKDAFLRDREANEIKVLDVALALDAFGSIDPILLAGLLRTFDRRDLRDTGHDHETDLAIGEYDMSPGKLSECGLAAVFGKLPPDAVVRRLRTSAPSMVSTLLLALLAG